MNNITTREGALHQIQGAPSINKNQNKSKPTQQEITSLSHQVLAQTQPNNKGNSQQNAHNRSKKWTKIEESLFREAMESSVSGNWISISKHVTTKTGYQCFHHWKDLQAKQTKPTTPPAVEPRTQAPTRANTQPLTQQPEERKPQPETPLDLTDLTNENIDKWNDNLNNMLNPWQDPPLLTQDDDSDLTSEKAELENDPTLAHDAVVREANHETTIWLEIE